MNTRLVRRTLSSPIWLACWSDECKGEIKEHQIDSVHLGKKPHTVFRCVTCDNKVSKTPAEIQALTDGIMEG